MLNRLTVSALLKIVILATAFCIVVGFSLNAWDSFGPPAGHEPDLGGRGRLGEPVQGDAQFAHRPLHHRPADQFRHDGCGYRKISARPARCRNAGDGQRARHARRHRISRSRRRWCRSSTVCSRRSPPCRRNSGTRPPAEGLAPPGLAKDYMDTTNALLETLDKLSATLAAERQPPGRRDRPAAGDQAVRLAVAQHRRRSLADRFDGPRRTDASRRRSRSTYTKIRSAAPTPRGRRWN